MGIGRRLKEAREAAGLTQEELGRLVGVTGSAITNYEKETSHPKEPVMYALMDALQVEPNFLFQDCVTTVGANNAGMRSHLTTKKEAPSDLSEEAVSFAYHYDMLSPHGRGAVNAILNYEVQLAPDQFPSPTPEEKPLPSKKVISLAKKRSDGFVEIRVYDQPAAAGLGNYLDEPPYHVEQYPDDVIPEKTDFGIKISGDSMEPEIHNGATVFVQSSPSIDPGQIGVFVLDSKAYCKRLAVDQERRQVRLVSANPTYEDIPVRPEDDFYTLGRVLGQYKPRFS